MKKYHYLETEIGLLELEETNTKLTKLSLVMKKTKPETPSLFLEKAKIELLEYFLGKRTTFDLELELIGTSFRKKVWEQLLEIPYGETVSYSEIAKKLGNVKLTRAVGGAIHHNPLLIFIPCHRVIGKNGSLTGFAYGTMIKEKLLKLEQKQK